MANLVLKPSTGAGNSVIIKDQAGGAVLTTADSGATIANATLASSNTFPAGHVLQMKGDSYTRTSALAITASSGLTIGSDLEVAITCASTSNFLHISTFIPDVAVLDQYCGIHVGFKYSTASPFGSGTSLGKTYVNSHDGYITTNDDILFGLSTELWVQVPTTTAMKIQVFTTAIISGSGVVKIMNNSNQSTMNEASLIVTEVQG